MNTEAIFTKYLRALTRISEETSQISGDAMALALHLAIQETAAASVPETAFVTAQNEAAMLRQQLATERAEVKLLIEELTAARADIEELRHAADNESAELKTEIAGLQAQLVALDADNAALTLSLATGQTPPPVVKPVTIHSNGTTPPPAKNTPRAIAPSDGDLADYWESLDAGRRKFRDLSRPTRLEMVKTVFMVLPNGATQADFNAVKPDWMPTGASLCVTFACSWPELSTLDPNRMTP